MAGPSPVHFIPIVTTGVAVLGAVVVFRRYRAKGGAHLLWWAIGMVSYAAGTLTESLTTLLGWHEPIFRAWYITGALLGGAPLAQGTVYLLLPRRIADRLTVALLLVVGVAAAAVIVAPIEFSRVEPFRLSGRVFAEQWVRMFSPFINLYSAALLIGGAVWSAVRYFRQPDSRRRAWANIAIAVGALLPGIGGSFTRFGHVEVLYVTELIGLILILVGYRLSTTAQAPSLHAAVRVAPPASIEAAV